MMLSVALYSSRRTVYVHGAVFMMNGHASGSAVGGAKVQLNTRRIPMSQASTFQLRAGLSPLSSRSGLGRLLVRRWYGFSRGRWRTGGQCTTFPAIFEAGEMAAAALRPFVPWAFCEG
eukprot:5066432-Prymnesium_polylepis.1